MPAPALYPGEDELTNVDDCFPFIASGAALEPNPPPTPSEEEPRPELRPVEEVPEGDDDFFSIDAKPVPTSPIFEAPNELGIDGTPPLPNPPESILPLNEPGPAPNPGKDDTAFILESFVNVALDFNVPWSFIIIPPELNSPANP